MNLLNSPSYAKVATPFLSSSWAPFARRVGGTAAAAVADYKPKNVAQQKIKKEETTFTIEFEKNQDILLSLGQIKKNQFLIGFALETENEIENAKSKIQKKNLTKINWKRFAVNFMKMVPVLMLGPTEINWRKK